MSKSWRGVFVVVPTPFKSDLSVDYEGLKQITRFCIDSGVHGVVASANASEVGYLTDEERRRVTETVLKEAAGRVGTIAGISSSCWPIACELARHAEANGADALMAMPPIFQRASEAEIRAYYGAIDKASALPMFLQNYGGPGGTPMSARLMTDLLRTLPNVKFVKEETEFSSVALSEVLAEAKELCHGVMGGKAGRALLDEYRRGACGTMPACEVSDIHLALWNALEAGDQAKAGEIYRLLLPLLSYEMGYGPAIYKEVLRRRGVIACSAFRQTGGRVLDALAQEELSAILSALEPLMDHRYRLAA
jgi:dihydrodipicolinate synthase/N-acetylneuraminate lyase